jgi:hypothetical protein
MLIFVERVDLEAAIVQPVLFAVSEVVFLHDLSRHDVPSGQVIFVVKRDELVFNDASRQVGIPGTHTHEEHTVPMQDGHHFDLIEG